MYILYMLLLLHIKIYFSVIWIFYMSIKFREDLLMIRGSSVSRFLNNREIKDPQTNRYIMDSRDLSAGFGVRSSRIHFSPMNAWRRNLKGRLRGGQGLAKGRENRVISTWLIKANGRERERRREREREGRGGRGGRGRAGSRGWPRLRQDNIYETFLIQILAYPGNTINSMNSVLLTMKEN